jgi:hypothetical protein
MEMVRHELNTHLTKEERRLPVVQRAIRNAVYLVRIYDFDNYEIIGKMDLN